MIDEVRRCATCGEPLAEDETHLVALAAEEAGPNAGVALALVAEVKRLREDVADYKKTIEYFYSQSKRHKAERDALAVRLAEVERERSDIAQAAWDAYGILGFDQDGDTEPHIVYPAFPEFIREFAREAREMHDEPFPEMDAALARLAAVQAAVEHALSLYPDDITAREVSAALNGEAQQ